MGGGGGGEGRVREGREREGREREGRVREEEWGGGGGDYSLSRYMSVHTTTAMQSVTSLSFSVYSCSLLMNVNISVA